METSTVNSNTKPVVTARKPVTQVKRENNTTLNSLPLSNTIDSARQSTTARITSPQLSGRAQPRIRSQTQNSASTAINAIRNSPAVTNRSPFQSGPGMNRPKSPDLINQSVKTHPPEISHEPPSLVNLTTQKSIPSTTIQQLPNNSMYNPQVIRNTPPIPPPSHQTSEMKADNSSNQINSPINLNTEVDFDFGLGSWGLDTHPMKSTDYRKSLHMPTTSIKFNDSIPHPRENQSQMQSSQLKPNRDLRRSLPYNVSIHL